MTRRSHRVPCSAGASASGFVGASVRFLATAHEPPAAVVCDMTAAALERDYGTLDGAHEAAYALCPTCLGLSLGLAVRTPNCALRLGL